MRSLRFALCGVALAGIVGLAACGSDDDGVGATTTAASTTAAASTAAPTTAAATTTTAGKSTASSTTAAPATSTTAKPTTTPAATTGSVPAAGELTLEDTTWTLSDRTDLGVGLAGVDVTARFVGATISGSAGCNQYSGQYVVNGDKLTIKPNVASTMMACPAPQMAVEAAYLKALPTVASYTITNDQLVLSNAAGKVVLVYDHISGDQVLAGAWEITALRTANAISSPVPGTTPTMTFTSGQVSGNTGCNTFTGTYKVSGDALTFGPLATTRKACTDAAVSQQETDLLAAIANTASFSATGQMVTLLAADGTITVTLVRG